MGRGRGRVRGGSGWCVTCHKLHSGSTIKFTNIFVSDKRTARLLRYYEFLTLSIILECHVVVYMTYYSVLG